MHPPTYMLALFAAVFVIFYAAISHQQISTLQDQPTIHAKIFEDGSAQLLIGDITCGLPPSNNNVAHARCHKAGDSR